MRIGEERHNNTTHGEHANLEFFPRPFQEVVVWKDAVCEEGEESTKKMVRNLTEGIDDGCSKCFCKEGRWKCQIMRCG